MPEAVDVNEAVFPETTLVSLGCAVTVGAVLTVSVAADVVAVLQTFVKTARYCLALSAAEVVNEYVVLVAPTMLLKVVPPSVDTCHWTVGDGEPEALAVKLASEPAHTVVFAGVPVIAGATFTVSVAAFDVVLPQASVKTARY